MHFLALYGYPFLFIWSLFEGEFGLMFAGLLVKKGVFEYKEVLLIAISGAILGDLITFFSAKFIKRKFDNENISKWFKKYGGLVIVFERFIYGTHIPTLIFVSLSGYKFYKFLIFDIIGVVLWAFCFVSIGYIFGERAVDLVIFIQQHIFIFIILVAMILVIRKKFI